MAPSANALAPARRQDRMAGSRASEVRCTVGDTATQPPDGGGVRVWAGVAATDSTARRKCASGFTGHIFRLVNIKTTRPAYAQLRVAKTYGPEQDGAKRFSRRYGDQLVCVRHRLNDDGSIRHTTVELVVESTPIATRERKVIALRIPATDRRSRALLLACGAKWRPKERYWLVQHLIAKNLRVLRFRVPIHG